MRGRESRLGCGARGFSACSRGHLQAANASAAPPLHILAGYARYSSPLSAIVGCTGVRGLGASGGGGACAALWAPGHLRMWVWASAQLRRIRRHLID